MFNTSKSDEPASATAALREIILGADFGWPGSTTTNTNYYWPTPSTLTATAEDPLVIKCSLAYAQGAINRGLGNFSTPLKDGRIVLKNLNGKEFLYDCEKSKITKDTVVTDPDA